MCMDWNEIRSRFEKCFDEVEAHPVKLTRRAWHENAALGLLRCNFVSEWSSGDQAVFYLAMGHVGDATSFKLMTPLQPPSLLPRDPRRLFNILTRESRGFTGLELVPDEHTNEITVLGIRYVGLMSTLSPDLLYHAMFSMLREKVEVEIRLPSGEQGSDYWAKATGERR
jgi:hypothetical protein